MAKITEKNLGNYSTFTADKGYKLDEFVEFTDIQADEYPLIDELQNLLRKQNKTPEELTRMSELNTKFADKIPTAWDWNKFCSCLISMEKFILVEINGYIALMKKDIKEYTDARKSEIETLIGQMDYKELWNKDVLYKRFNQVKYNGNVYTARKDNIGQVPNPIQDTESWQITSMKGDKGDKGDRGYDGVNLVPKGGYNNNETYSKFDLVTYDGRSHYCKIEGTKGILPINTENWELFADKGLSTVVKTFKSHVVLEKASSIVPINIPEFNIQEDDLEVNYMGSLLTEGIAYKKSPNGLTIESVDGSIWNKEIEFDFRVMKNVNSHVTYLDPALMENGSITKNKLNPTILQEIDDKIVILNGQGELKEKVNKSDLDIYINSVKSSLDEMGKKDETLEKSINELNDNKVNNTDFDKINSFVKDVKGTSTAYLGSIKELKNYVEGMTITLVPHVDCIENPTLNINGTGAVNLVNQDGNLKAGDMKANKPYSFVRVGNSFFIRSSLRIKLPKFVKNDSWNNINTYYHNFKNDNIISCVVRKKIYFFETFYVNLPKTGWSMYIYDTETDIFSEQHFDKSVPIIKPCCCSIGDEIYTFTFQTSEIRAFDTLTNTWQTKPNTPKGSIIASIGSKIYTVGEGSTDCYDTINGSWTPKSKNTRVGYDSVAVGNKIYTIGGNNSYGSKQNDCYDSILDAWTPKADMKNIRGYCNCASIGDEIYVCGGEKYASNTSGNTDDDVLNVVESYNTKYNWWNDKANMKHIRKSFVLESVDGILYAIGGDIKNFVNSISINECYIP